MIHYHNFVVVYVKKKKIKSANLLMTEKTSLFIASLMYPCIHGTLPCQAMYVKIKSE